MVANAIIKCEKPKGIWKNRMPAEANILFFETPTVDFKSWKSRRHCTS
jgi:hypothetical protein